MGLPIGVFDIVYVVSGDYFEVKFTGDFEEVRDDAALFFDAVIHQFDNEIFFAKYIDESAGGGTGFFVVTVSEETRDDCGETTGKADEPFTVCGKGLQVGAWVVVEALRVGAGDDFTEVLVARKVACEKTHMVGLLFCAFFFCFSQLVFENEVDLATKEGLNAVFFSLLEEAGEAIEYSVVGNGQCFHAEFGSTLAEAVRARASIKQAVVCVDVQVNEFAVFLRHLI